MPDRMPDRMPENMSDRMPEDLPVTKCINVMVGITRSKVIFGFHQLDQPKKKKTCQIPQKIDPPFLAPKNYIPYYTIYFHINPMKNPPRLLLKSCNISHTPKNTLLGRLVLGLSAWHNIHGCPCYPGSCRRHPSYWMEIPEMWEMGDVWKMKNVSPCFSRLYAI